VLRLVTEIGWYKAPTGTANVNEVVLPEVNMAFVAPKNTILLASVVLKLVPVIVTVVPIGPKAGAKFVMVGWAKEEKQRKKSKDIEVNVRSKTIGLLVLLNVFSILYNFFHFYFY
jgi:hypothetical protein